MLGSTFFGAEMFRGSKWFRDRGVHLILLLEYLKLISDMKMTDENMLTGKCLEIANHILEKDQRAFINNKMVLVFVSLLATKNQPLK